MTQSNIAGLPVSDASIIEFNQRLAENFGPHVNRKGSRAPVKNIRSSDGSQSITINVQYRRQ